MKSRTPNHEKTARPPRGVFFVVAMMMFFLGLSASESVGFVPYYVDGSSPASEKIALSSIPQLGQNEKGITPERIQIPKVNIDLPIQNPVESDNDTLDALLASGSVRYPSSALLGQGGSMFIFAHSSHLPVVRNPMYKAFNNIEKLSIGDDIAISGGGKIYNYNVTSVHHADASEEIVNISRTGAAKLILSTCDNFGAKTARWVVEAELTSVN